MKKGILIVIVLLLSFAILEIGDNLVAETAISESAGTTLTGTGKGFGGDVTVTVTMEGNKITKVEAEGASETAGIGTNALEQLPAKIVEANSTDVEVISGATVTSNAIIEAVNNALSSATSESSSGTVLTGTGKGFGGDVTVTVTMEGDKITKVEAEGASETAGIGTNALEQLPAKIVEANSTDVEVISGATVTSNAIIEAVNNALSN